MAEMDPSAGATAQRRAFPRVPLRAKVRMEFAEQRCFLSEWAVNLSPGGMFVRSEAPMTSGQRFQFEASLTPKGPRFEGVGEVTWVRRRWEGSARPPGFAVRFLELQEEGRAAMLRLADVFLEGGVGAMQEELAAMTAAWQRRRLDDESTDELHPAEELDEPLADTAVLDAPWVTAPLDLEADTLPPQPAPAGPDGGDGPRPDAVAPREPTARSPAPAASPAEGTRTAARPRRRGGWWVVGLVLLLAGAGFLALHGSLPGRLGGIMPTARPAAGRPLGGPRALPAGASGAEGGGQFGGLDDVSWSEDGDGISVVLALDGTLPETSLHRFRPPEAPPREVIQLLGARHGYSRPVVPVHSPLLEQIRIGFHQGDGDELRVVLELTSPAVVLRSMESDGRSLRLRLAREDEAESEAIPPAAETAAPAAPAVTAAAATKRPAPGARRPATAAASPRAGAGTSPTRQAASRRPRAGATEPTGPTAAVPAATPVALSPQPASMASTPATGATPPPAASDAPAPAATVVPVATVVPGATAEDTPPPR